MKKLFLILALAVTLCGCKGENNNASSSKKDGGLKNEVNLMTIEGPCIVVEDGSYLIVSERGEPIVMSAENKDIFKELTTGDTIKIKCEYIMESYPAQTNISDFEFVKDGEPTDVPQDLLLTLEELGWIAVTE